LDFAGGRVVFVASTGGHLAQLHRLAKDMNASDDSPWITFDSKQSTSLLRGAPVTFVPYIRPRGYRASALALRRIYRTISEAKAEAVVSTGSAVAGPAFVAARLLGVPCHYIESVSRIEGPSLTGRAVAALHLAQLRTQNWGWANARWKPYPSVLSPFEAFSADGTAARRDHPKVFVTVGTIRPYRFDALIDAVLATGLADDETVWQVGVTTRQDLPGRIATSVTVEEFTACALNADVVITHAGVGSVLTLLDAGVYPIVVPRRRARGEHVDDHQTQIAAMLAREGLADVYEADEIDASSLRSAVGKRVRLRQSLSAG
jgi:UDP-N-acetylglucosamine transferase subunit ALG13